MDDWNSEIGSRVAMSTAEEGGIPGGVIDGRDMRYCTKATWVGPEIQPVNISISGEYAHHYADWILAHHPDIRDDTVAAIASVKSLEFRSTSGGGSE